MLFQSLKKISDEIIKGAKPEMYKAIDASLTDAADMNREQLVFGLNSENKAVGEYRSEPYAHAKKAIGGRAPFGIPDLKLTGDFHSSIFTRRSGDALTFGATDKKTAELTTKYGTEILGLTKENTTELSDNYILPIWWDWVSAKIQSI